MQRIDTSTAAADLHGKGKNGFTDGDPATGLAATELAAAWFNAVQEEVANIIELSGGTLDKSNNAQVYQAITNMINNANKGVAYATDTAAGTVELATTAEARAGVNVKTAITPATLKDALANGLGPVYATDTSAGTVELATTDEARAGADARTVITPATLKAALDNVGGPTYATDTSAGTVELATKSEAGAGTDARTVITPATLEHRLSSFGAGVPMGTVLPFMFSTPPDDWILVYGQTIYRSSYPDFFTALNLSGSSYGLPDQRGRVIAGKDNMGGSSANRLTGQSGGVNGDYLLSTGGAETHTLSTSQMPRHQHSILARGRWNTAPGYPMGHSGRTIRDAGAINVHRGPTYTANNGTSYEGSSSYHNNVQPTIIMNMIMRVK